jgi:hypothetical protein
VLLLSKAAKEGGCEGPRVLEEHIKLAKLRRDSMIRRPASSPSGCERERQNSLATSRKEYHEKTAADCC